MSRRKQRLRQAKEKQIFIFSEGNTELCYFNQVKSVFNFKTLNVKNNLGQLSGNKLSGLNNIKNKIYENIEFNKKDLKSTNSKIFYLLDIDGFNRNSYIQEEINFIKKNFEDDYIKVIFSNKDFELWILLHFIEYKKEDGKYIEEISKNIKKDYKKGNCNIDFFKKIIEENLNTAIENGKKLEKYQENRNSNLKDKNPYTEVYKIFEELEI